MTSALLAPCRRFEKACGPPRASRGRRDFRLLEGSYIPRSWIIWVHFLTKGSLLEADQAKS